MTCANMYKYTNTHTHTHYTADVLTAEGAVLVIAVDVGSENNNELTNYGDYVSGWSCLWNKINPLAKKMRVSRTYHRKKEEGEGGGGSEGKCF